MTPKALVLRTAGTNCDQETIHALNVSGAQVTLLHFREILQKPSQLFNYSILVIPGGFSYGDDVAAGKILANELKLKLRKELGKFVREKRMIIGICNGFQVLVKTGLLPGEDLLTFTQTATLTQNDSARFQCQWVRLKKESSRAKWLQTLPREFELPIAHGEGKFMTLNPAVLKEIETKGQVIFRYAQDNPNGSTHAIAGICNAGGNVVGLMPHPERYVTPYQHPDWGRGVRKGHMPGLLFWMAAVKQSRLTS